MLSRLNSKFVQSLVFFCLFSGLAFSQTADDILDEKLSSSVDKVLYQWLNSLEGFPDTVKSIIRVRCELDSLKNVHFVEINKADQLPKNLADSLTRYIKQVNFDNYPHSAFNYTITYYYFPDNTDAVRIWVREKFRSIIPILTEKYKHYQLSRSSRYEILLYFKVILGDNGKPSIIEWLTKPEQNASFLYDVEDYLKTVSFKNKELTFKEFQFGFELR